MGSVARLVAGLGRPLVAAVAPTRSVLHVLGATLAYVLSGRFDRRETLRQMVEVGWRSWAFVSLTLSVMGMIGVFQVATQAARILPEYSMMGAAFIELMVREFAPTITGLMIATRVGSGIAAELGTMVVTEQVDALRMCNADPVRYVVAPRFVACTLMTVVLAVHAAAIAILAGAVVAKAGWGVSYATFWNFRMTQWNDVLTGLAKALAYGVAIPVLAGDSGLRATGGAEGVGWATTRAVVSSSFAVIVLDFVVGGIAYLIV